MGEPVSWATFRTWAHACSVDDAAPWRSQLLTASYSMSSTKMIATAAFFHYCSLFGAPSFASYQTNTARPPFSIQRSGSPGSTSQQERAAHGIPGCLYQPVYAKMC